ncbi:MAG: DinB family protein [Lewinellaceae bacterium]|nr:DinB family protein [Lewinellaceae bacterium]
MKNLLLLLSCIFMVSATTAQSRWTEEGRQYLLDNLRRTTAELEKEVAGMTNAQWHFKENPDSWSIAQVIEHLGIYERKYYDERRVVSLLPPEPELAQSTPPDAYYLEWMAEEQPHNAPAADVPTGFMQGKDNWAYFLAGRERNLKMIETTDVDFRAFYTYRSNGKRWNLHQLYIILFAHCDRHLRQVRRIKSHPDFPKEGMEVNEKRELAVILKVVEAETGCFFARDYDCWKENWVQEAHAFQAWNNADGTFDARTGWAAVDKEIGDYIKNNPVGPAKTSHPKVIRKNFTVKFYGENAAYLTWDQYNSDPEGRQFRCSKESRIVEKHGGEWKIAHVSAFWDYKNRLAEQDVE